MLRQHFNYKPLSVKPLDFNARTVAAARDYPKCVVRADAMKYYAYESTT